MTFGFRSLSGPFVQLGWEAFKALAWSFVAVCAVDVVAGIGLWRSRRWAVRLGFFTSPLTFVLGLGFALPLVLIGVLIRVALVLAGHRGLR